MTRCFFQDLRTPGRKSDEIQNRIERSLYPLRKSAPHYFFYLSKQRWSAKLQNFSKFVKIVKVAKISRSSPKYVCQFGFLLKMPGAEFRAAIVASRDEIYSEQRVKHCKAMDKVVKLLY